MVIVLILAFAITWVSSAVSLLAGYPFFNFLLPNVPFLNAIAIINILILLSVPLVSLVLLLMKILFKTRIRKSFSFGIWSFWMLNLLSLIFIAFFVVKQFQASEHKTETITTISQDIDTLSIRGVYQPEMDTWLNIDNKVKVVDEDLYIDHVRIFIVRSEDSAYSMAIERSALGENASDAQSLAELTQYDISMERNTLNLPTFYRLPKGSKWRNQKVKVMLAVPEGKIISTDPILAKRITYAEIDGENSDISFTDAALWQMTNKGFIPVN